MNTKILLNKRVSITVALVIVAFSVITSATYAKSIFDIEFPIAELGSCKDKVECKVYCAVAENQDACENFAASYGIGNAVEKRKERQVRGEAIARDGGPGNCALNTTNPETSCRAYCGTLGNMSECVAYGKEHGLMKGRKLDDAENVVKVLQGGLLLPAGCTDEKSCKQTCEEPQNVGIARACFAFAEKAGILPEGVDRERAEKVFKLIEEGKSPFRSPKDFRQCENPVNDEIMQKCITFAADNGLMSTEDSEIIKKTGGKGPGGCRGKDQCDLYCSENQNECMKFAEDNNLIKPEQKARMAEGMLRFKESISNAPAEVRQCLSDAIGADNLEQLILGRQTPNRDFGDRMRLCFEKSSSRMRDGGRVMMNEKKEGFNRMIQDGQSNNPMMYGGGTSTEQMKRIIPIRPDEQTQGRPQGMMFPPQVQECIKNKIGEEALNGLVAGKTSPDEKVKQTISGCMQEFGASKTQSSGQDGVPPRMMPPQFKPGEKPAAPQQGLQGQQYSDDAQRILPPVFQGGQMRQFDGIVPSGMSPQNTEKFVVPPTLQSPPATVF